MTAPPSKTPPRGLSSQGVPVISPALPIDHDALLPDQFRRWFAARGWSPREHQLALLAKARDNSSALLIAPTGAGKTLAGFLPTLVELSAGRAAPSPLPSWEGSTVEGRRERGEPRRSELAAARSRQPSPTRGEGADRAPGNVVSTGRGVTRSRGLHTLYI